jgi:type III secretion protein U
VRLAGAPAAGVLAALGRLALELAGALALATVALGAADFALRWGRHRRALRMTRDELRRERKEAEGDPVHRAERRRRHREVV